MTGVDALYDREESRPSCSRLNLDSLDSALRRPRRRTPLSGILKCWRHDEVVVVCDRTKNLEDCPDLSLRIRGALGRRLRERHLQDPPGSGPSAWDVLWLYSPPRGWDVEIARPYVVQASIIGDILVAVVRLFGCSRQFAPEVLSALVEALTSGIRLKTPRGIFVRHEVRQAEVLRFDGLEIGARETSTCHLHFVTAAAVRNGRSLVLNPVSVVMSSVRRVAAVVPWMGMELDFDDAKLRAACEELRFDMDGVRPANWVRYSLRQGSEEIPVHGLVGDVYMHGNLSAIYPYLRLAEITGIGSSTALGLGQIGCIFT